MKKLKQQIQSLERQRAAELRNATYLLARTRKDFRHTLSPERLIRKHTGIALTLAAVGGFLLAPRTGRAARRAAQENTRSSRPWLALLRPYLPASLRHLVPQAETPGAQPAPTPTPMPAQGRRGLLELLLVEVATVAARRINWTALLQNLLPRFGSARSAPAPDEPSVGIANVGTTRPGQKFDGQR